MPYVGPILTTIIYLNLSIIVMLFFCSSNLAQNEFLILNLLI